MRFLAIGIGCWAHRVLAVWLASAAVAKLAALPDPETLLRLPFYIAVVAIELALAALLLVQASRRAGPHATSSGHFNAR